MLVSSFSKARLRLHFAPKVSCMALVFGKSSSYFTPRNASATISSQTSASSTWLLLAYRSNTLCVCHAYASECQEADRGDGGCPLLTQMRQGTAMTGFIHQRCPWGQSCKRLPGSVHSMQASEHQPCPAKPARTPTYTHIPMHMHTCCAHPHAVVGGWPQNYLGTGTQTCCAGEQQHGDDANTHTSARLTSMHPCACDHGQQHYLNVKTLLHGTVCACNLQHDP